MIRHAVVFSLLLAALRRGSCTAAERLVLLPSECELSTPESRQHLILQELERDEAGRQVTEKIAWSSSDPEVATVVDGLVIPVHDGQTTITAKVGEHTATAKVVVSGMSRPFDWSFRNHVEPMLAKLGCNSGLATAPWPARAASGSRCAATIRRPTTSTSSSKIAAAASSSPTRAAAWCWPSPPERSPTRAASGSRPTRSTTASSREWLSDGAAPPERRRRPRRATGDPAGRGRSSTSARASRSWSAPATPTAGPKTSPAG